MKKSSILAAVLALGIAAAATTACAFENEFHGMFAAQYINSNFNGTDVTSVGINNAARYGGDGQYSPGGKTRNPGSANFIEQRARLQYIAKASADLKLVTQFEIDYTYWGNSAYTTGRGTGGAVGADSVNFETKNIYIDANPYKNLNMKLGMMPYNDAFKGVVFDADMAGIAFSSSYDHVTPSIGYFRFNDTGVNDNPTTNNKSLGHLTNDMFLLDAKYEVNKDLRVGAAYYFFRNNAITTNANDFTAPNSPQDVKVSNFGLNAEYTAGPLTLNGFGILQAGTTNNRNSTAWALNSGAKLKTGPGTARFEFLYTSGDKSATGHSNAFYSVFSTANFTEHGYYDNEMVILGRDKNAFTTDNSIILSAGNQGQGQIGGYIGYDLPINPKLTTAFNAGFAGVAKSNIAKPVIYQNRVRTTQRNSSNYLGTEVNAEATYVLLDGLTVGVRAAYVMLGDYYDNVASNGTPVNPYDCKLMFRYKF